MSLLRYILWIPLLLLGAAPAPGPDMAPFTFAVIADPHLSGKPDEEARLAACVRWINAERKKQKIELVFVVGDIAWGKGRMARAKKILDPLKPAWVPVIGDNEVTGGSELDFEKVFSPHLAALAKRLDHWKRAPVPVVPPKTERREYLQNYSFDHHGVHFVCLDWVTRTGGETADLHDYPGGTWPWFRKDLAAAARGPRNRIVMISHLPMHHNPIYEVFSKAEQTRVEEVTRKYGDWVYACFAGHYHFNWWEWKVRGRYQLFVTDATFDDQNRFRLVHVSTRFGSFIYRHEMITVPEAKGVK